MSYGPALPPASPKNDSGEVQVKKFPQLPPGYSDLETSGEDEFGPSLPGEGEQVSRELGVKKQEKKKKRKSEDTGSHRKNKKKKSLLDIHDDKRKKEKHQKPPGVKDKVERKAFDPSVDMQGDTVRLVSASQRNKIISNAETGLTSRFSASSSRR